MAGVLALEALAAGQGGAAASPGNGSPSQYIDQMVQEAWEEAGLKPSPEAPDHEYVRRVYLDILGRIPSAKEASAFLSGKSSTKRSELVSALLEHPDYTKNFSTVWSNLLIGRLDQPREVNRQALAAWLKQSFEENRPWNEVAKELISARGSSKDNGAVNFTIAHLRDDAVNLTSYTTRLFLGQQVQCTQCHDHPTNTWKQSDFWSINAFYKGVRTREVTRTDDSGEEVYEYTEVFDEPTGAFSTFETRSALMKIAFPAFLDGTKIPQGPEVDRRPKLAEFIASGENRQFSRAIVNRMWGHFLGRGFVEPVDDFGSHNPASHPELLDRLAQDFEASGHDLKALIQWITASKAYQLSSVKTKENQGDESLFSSMRTKPLTPEQLFDSLLVATGAHKAGGDQQAEERRARWMQQFVFAFSNDEAEEGTSFQGTIPQALMMMNGELIARATSSEPGSFLGEVKAQAMAQGKGRAEAAVVNALYLSSLSRYPSRAEAAGISRYLMSNPDTSGVLEDLFWALLNSNEFILNH